MDRRITIVTRGGKIIPVEEVFAEDTEQVSELCMNIFHDALYHDRNSYTGCYRSESRPRLSDFKKAPGWVEEYKQAVLAWEKANPDEVREEQKSNEEWTNKAKDRFKALFRLAKKHHVRLEWCGVSPYYIRKDNKKVAVNTPDRWIVRKGGSEIGLINCM